MFKISAVNATLLTQKKSKMKKIILISGLFALGLVSCNSYKSGDKEEKGKKINYEPDSASANFIDAHVGTKSSF